MLSLKDIKSFEDSNKTTLLGGEATPTNHSSGNSDSIEDVVGGNI